MPFMKKIIILIIPFFLLTASPLLAANPLVDNPLVDEAAKKAGFNIDAEDSETFFIEALGKVIFTFVSLLGILFVILIIYGAYIWMYARGNENEVERARHIIRDAIVGIIVLAGSYSVWLLIQKFLFGA